MKCRVPQGKLQLLYITHKSIKCSPYCVILRAVGCKQLMSCCWLLLLVNLDREQFLFIIKAHSKYVSTFDIDKIHANELENKAALLRFLGNGQRGRFVQKNFGSALISHSVFSLTYMCLILKDARHSSLKYSSYLCSSNIFPPLKWVNSSF